MPKVSQIRSPKTLNELIETINMQYSGLVITQHDACSPSNQSGDWGLQLRGEQLR